MKVEVFLSRPLGAAELEEFLDDLTEGVIKVDGVDHQSREVVVEAENIVLRILIEEET